MRIRNLAFAAMLVTAICSVRWARPKAQEAALPVQNPEKPRVDPPEAVEEPEWQELVPLSLDLDGWETDEDGRRVFAGEELEYQIRWQGVPAGRALLRVKARHAFPDDNGPEVWHVRLDVRSNRFLSFVYPVEGKIQSRIDVKGGFSRQYAKDQEEGEVRSKERVLFDYTLDKLEASYEYPAWHRVPAEDRLRKKAPWMRVTIPLNGKVLDPLSVVYYLRGLDMLPGRSWVLPVVADRRVWNTSVRVEARESVTSPDGVTWNDCFRLRPACHFNGLFERRGPITLWVESQHKVVVRMTVETPLGACEVWLERHTRSPLDR